MDQENIELTVIIPAYNEQARIADTLIRIKEYLQHQEFTSEIVIVDDGSKDLTLEVVKTIDICGSELEEQESTRLTTDITNHGKGAAVRRGFELARGRVVLFTDADLSTPIEEVEKMLPLFDTGADLVIGSRRMTDSDVERQPWHRRLMGWVFSSLVRQLAVPEIRDSQCGFKCYTRECARTLAGLQKMTGFSFDVEHLFLARRLGWKIVEIPVRWVDAPGSTVSPIKDSWRMFCDLLRIRRLHRELTISSAVPQGGSL